MASAASNAAAISAASQQAAAMHAGAFNSYTGQLAVSVQENAAANGQWAEGMKVSHQNKLKYIFQYKDWSN